MVTFNAATALAILAFTDRALAAPAKRQSSLPESFTETKLNSLYAGDPPPPDMKRQTSDVWGDLVDSITEKRHPDEVSDFIDSLQQKREDQLANLSPAELSANNNFQLYQKRQDVELELPIWAQNMIDSKQSDPTAKRAFMDGAVEVSEEAGDLFPQKREDQLANLSPAELSANNNFQLWQKKRDEGLTTQELQNIRTNNWVE